jgi:hypothetical protein
MTQNEQALLDDLMRTAKSKQYFEPWLREALKRDKMRGGRATTDAPVMLEMRDAEMQVTIIRGRDYAE